MAKRRRPDARRSHGLSEEIDPSEQLRAAIFGTRTVTAKRGQEWTVREVSGHAAQKAYRCPGCPNDIAVGEAHVVVWRNDHLLGDGAAVSDRRHWHRHCWRIA